MCNTFPQHRGAALITALFIMTLIAIVAVAMNVQLLSGIERTRLLQNRMQLQATAHGITLWAQQTLITNWQKQKNSSKAVDKLPLALTQTIEGGMQVSANLTDAQGKFNVNNLLNRKLIPNFSHLLRVVLPKVSEQQAMNIATATADWISPANVKAANQYVSIYAKQRPPYQAPHQPMVDISELRLVSGITADIFEKLAPYVIALPEATAVNLNAATVPVIMSLEPKLTRSQAQSLVDFRNLKAGLMNSGDFHEFEDRQSWRLPDTNITFQSDYFLVHGSVNTLVTKGKQVLHLTNILHRQIRHHTAAVAVISP